MIYPLYQRCTVDTKANVNLSDTSFMPTIHYANCDSKKLNSANSSCAELQVAIEPFDCWKNPATYITVCTVPKFIRPITNISLRFNTNTPPTLQIPSKASHFHLAKKSADYAGFQPGYLFVDTCGWFQGLVTRCLQPVMHSLAHSAQFAGQARTGSLPDYSETVALLCATLCSQQLQ